MTAISRRIILAGGAALAVPEIAAAACSAGPADDAIFAAIAKYDAALGECKAIPDASFDDPRREDLEDLLLAKADIAAEAVHALAETIPTTFAGALAMLAVFNRPHPNFAADELRFNAGLQETFTRNLFASLSHANREVVA